MSHHPALMASLPLTQAAVTPPMAHTLSCYLHRHPQLSHTLTRKKFAHGNSGCHHHVHALVCMHTCMSVAHDNSRCYCCMHIHAASAAAIAFASLSPLPVTSAYCWIMCGGEQCPGLRACVSVDSHILVVVVVIVGWC